MSLVCSVTTSGLDGNIQYCLYSIQTQVYDIYDYTPSSQCRACFDGPERVCPWNCNAGCTVVDNGYDYSYSLFKALYTCEAGCIYTDVCFQIDNGYFTGSGANVGYHMSCPFDCNSGYVKVENSCVSDVPCAGGMYKPGGECIPCPFCQNGYWLDGCTGTNAGVCKECTN